MDFRSELWDADSQAIDDKVEKSGGINASSQDSQFLALEQSLGVRLDQLVSVTFPESWVVVNMIDSSSAAVVLRANEFFTGLSISLFLKDFSFLVRQTG